MKVSIRVDSKRLYAKIEKAIDNFKDMESRQCNSIDIEKCTKDYVYALMIFDQTLYEQKIIK